MDLLQEDFIYPRNHVRHGLLRMQALYFTSSGLLTKSTRLPHRKAWRSQDNFLYNSDRIHL